MTQRTSDRFEIKAR